MAMTEMTTEIDLGGKAKSPFAPPSKYIALDQALVHKSTFCHLVTIAFSVVSLSLLAFVLAKLNHIEAELLVPRIPLPGYAPGAGMSIKLVLAQDVDWPPYAYYSVPPEGDYTLAGFGRDVAMGLSSVCPDLEVTTVQTKWSDCWSQGHIGGGLLGAHYHACTTYTHTKGERGRFLEFSNSILKDNKPAGLITRLNVDGTPVISPMSDLSGVKVVDVRGWAPTADGLTLVTNACNGKRFSGYTLVEPADDGNDAAMALLRSGAVDAIWVYADQAHNYQPKAGVEEDWNVTMWQGLGESYAYIHTGMHAYSYNGTTLTMAPLGSGVAEIVNPCIQAFMETKDYYDVCSKHLGLYGSCYRNAFFPAEDPAAVVEKPWEAPTNEQSGPCSTGYCACDA